MECAVKDSEEKIKYNARLARRINGILSNYKVVLFLIKHENNWENLFGINPNFKVLHTLNTEGTSNTYLERLKEIAKRVKREASFLPSSYKTHSAPVTGNEAECLSFAHQKFQNILKKMSSTSFVPIEHSHYTQEFYMPNVKGAAKKDETGKNGKSVNGSEPPNSAVTAELVGLAKHVASVFLIESQKERASESESDCTTSLETSSNEDSSSDDGDNSSTSSSSSGSSCSSSDSDSRESYHVPERPKCNLLQSDKSRIEEIVFVRDQLVTGNNVKTLSDASSDDDSAKRGHPTENTMFAYNGDIKTLILSEDSDDEDKKTRNLSLNNGPDVLVTQIQQLNSPILHSYQKDIVIGEQNKHDIEVVQRLVEQEQKVPMYCSESSGSSSSISSDSSNSSSSSEDENEAQKERTTEQIVSGFETRFNDLKEIAPSGEFAANTYESNIIPSNSLVHSSSSSTSSSSSKSSSSSSSSCSSECEDENIIHLQNRHSETNKNEVHDGMPINVESNASLLFKNEAKPNQESRNNKEESKICQTIQTNVSKYKEEGINVEISGLSSLESYCEDEEKSVEVQVSQNIANVGEDRLHQVSSVKRRQPRTKLTSTSSSSGRSKSRRKGVRQAKIKSREFVDETFSSTDDEKPLPKKNSHLPTDKLLNASKSDKFGKVILNDVHQISATVNSTSLSSNEVQQHQQLLESTPKKAGYDFYSNGDDDSENDFQESQNKRKILRKVLGGRKSKMVEVRNKKQTVKQDISTPKESVHKEDIKSPIILRINKRTLTCSLVETLSSRENSNSKEHQKELRNAVSEREHFTVNSDLIGVKENVKSPYTNGFSKLSENMSKAIGKPNEKVCNKQSKLDRRDHCARTSGMVSKRNLKNELLTKKYGLSEKCLKEKVETWNDCNKNSSGTENFDDLQPKLKQPQEKKILQENGLVKRYNESRQYSKKEGKLKKDSYQKKVKEIYSWDNLFKPDKKASVIPNSCSIKKDNSGTDSEVILAKSLKKNDEKSNSFQVIAKKSINSTEKVSKLLGLSINNNNNNKSNRNIDENFTTTFNQYNKNKSSNIVKKDKKSEDFVSSNLQEKKGESTRCEKKALPKDVELTRESVSALSKKLTNTSKNNNMKMSIQFGDNMRSTKNQGQPSSKLIPSSKTFHPALELVVITNNKTDDDKLLSVNNDLNTNLKFKKFKEKSKNDRKEKDSSKLHQQSSKLHKSSSKFQQSSSKLVSKPKNSMSKGLELKSHLVNGHQKFLQENDKIEIGKELSVGNDVLRKVALNKRSSSKEWESKSWESRGKRDRSPSSDISQEKKHRKTPPQVCVI